MSNHHKGHHGSSPRSRQYGTSPRSGQYNTSPRSVKYSTSPRSGQIDTSPRSEQYDTSPRSVQYNSYTRRHKQDGLDIGCKSTVDVHRTWETGYISKQKSVYLQRAPDLSLGLSIRGGAEHGIGIYVSSVDVGSVAEEHGVTVGDQILSVNTIPFTNISHHQAAEIIGMYDLLEMELQSIGRIPGSHESLQTYTWVDPNGVMVSPPQEVDRVARYDLLNRSPMILKEADERKVNIVLRNGAKLGLLIRGGREFGLGIYATGVDQGSSADGAGIQPGDQILDVNGNSFLDVSHSEAVKMLKSSRHLILTVKDVGKIPHTRCTFDNIHWDEPVAGHEQGGFVRGVGSQLMHTSHQHSKWSVLQERSNQSLGASERELLIYYLKGYEGKIITIDALILALQELLDTKNKLQVTDDVRCFIRPQDLHLFDNMVKHNPSTNKQPSAEHHKGNGNNKIAGNSRYHHSPKLDVLRSPSDDSGVDVNNGGIDGSYRYPDQLEHNQGHSGGHRRSYPFIPEGGGHIRYDNNIASSYPDKCGWTDGDMWTDHNGRYSLEAYRNDRTDTCANDRYDRYKHEVSETHRTNHSGTHRSDHSGTHISDHSGTHRSDHSDTYSTDLDVYSHSPINQPMRPPRKKAHFKSRSPMSKTPSVEFADRIEEDTRIRQQHHSRYQNTEVRGRQGILKESSHRQRSRQDRVPCIKIENWEDMKCKLEKGMPELKQQQPTNKKEGRHYRQKFKLTPEEMTILKVRVREKLHELEKKKIIIEMSSDKKGNIKDEFNQNNNNQFTVKTHKLVKPKPIEEIINENTSDNQQKGEAQGCVSNRKLVSENNRVQFDDRKKIVTCSRELPHYNTCTYSQNESKLAQTKRLQNRKQLDATSLTESDNVVCSPAGQTTMFSPDSSNLRKPVTNSLTRSELKRIQVYNCRSSLGLVIEGGENTRQPLPKIVNIKENSSAYESELSCGQLILEVNGQSMRGLTHAQCVHIISSVYQQSESMDFLVVNKSNQEDLTLL